jgi:hypothetical protein
MVRQELMNQGNGNAAFAYGTESTIFGSNLHSNCSAVIWKNPCVLQLDGLSRLSSLEPDQEIRVVGN